MKHFKSSNNNKDKYNKSLKIPHMLNNHIPVSTTKQTIIVTYLTNNKTSTIPGYTTYATNHPDGTAYAGIAILIK